MNLQIATALADAGKGTWSTAAVVQNGTLIAAFPSTDGSNDSFKSLSAADIEMLPRIFTSRHTALETGIVLEAHEETFAVHQIHENVADGVNVIYGRGGSATSGEGVAVARLSSGVYTLVTYRLPVVSALAVEVLVKFVDRTLRGLVPT